MTNGFAARQTHLYRKPQSSFVIRKLVIRLSGECRIRTCEGRSQQIYSLSRLTASVTPRRSQLLTEGVGTLSAEATRDSRRGAYCSTRRQISPSPSPIDSALALDSIVSSADAAPKIARSADPRPFRQALKGQGFRPRRSP
jgi:hypothetical protein